MLGSPRKVKWTLLELFKEIREARKCDHSVMEVVVMEKEIYMRMRGWLQHPWEDDPPVTTFINREFSHLNYLCYSINIAY